MGGLTGSVSFLFRKPVNGSPLVDPGLLGP